MPKKLSAIAGGLMQGAADIKVDASDPYADSLNLAIYHMYAAARLLRDVAEAKASKEGVQV